MNEFDVIDYVCSQQKISRPDVIVGIGDDCAIIAPQKKLAVSTDTLLAGVHFPLETSAYNIGYKSLAVNLSDLAAMGAEPAFAMIALTLPEADKKWIKEFCNGFFDLAAHHNVQLIGGDLTEGPLSITVQAFGYVDRILKRSAAQVNDLIYVTNCLGDAACALKYSDNHYLLARLNCPTPRVDAGLFLKDIANAAIDISDGLLADLQHILKQSGVGAEIFIDKIPLSKELLETVDRPTAIELALTGGDDYELCFTIAADKKHLLPANFTQIGIITENPQLILKDKNGKTYEAEVSGYQHFKEA